MSETQRRHIYRIDDGEQSWYSATSEKEALAMAARDAGYASVEVYACDWNPEVERLQDGEPLTVRDEESGRTVTRTCREWAEQGTGCVATTAV